MGKQWKQWQTLFGGGSKITADGDYSHEIKTHLLLGRKVVTKLDSLLKTETLLCQQSPSSQSYVFSIAYLWIWELDYKESWALKNWYFWTVVLEKTLKSLLQHHNLKASILQCSVFFMVQLSLSYMTTGETIALTRQTFVSKVMCFLTCCLDLS